MPQHDGLQYGPRSAGKLSYGIAQDVIEGKVLGDVAIAPEHNASDVAHDITILHSIAQQLRTRRFHAGTLAIESVKLAFKLDANGLPTDCDGYSRYDAHKLVEEVSAVVIDGMLRYNG